jgi:hypothetical protein
MSGGSHNYIYARLEEECAGKMYDVELNDLIADIVNLLKALEWWQSGDTEETTYRAKVYLFKKKWLAGDVQERRDNLIEKELERVKNELYEAFRP